MSLSAEEIKSALTNGLKKEAKTLDLGKIEMGNVAKMTAAITAAGILGKTVDGVADYMKNKSQAHIFNTVTAPANIEYALKKYPELKQADKREMHSWLSAARSIAPKIAQNKVLSASYLKTVHDFGGNVDMSTVNMLAEINKNTSSTKSSGYGKDGMSVLSAVAG
jgi:hypothetical protein